MTQDELYRLLREIIPEPRLEYVSVGQNTSILDGNFTSDQLRRLADLMDLYKSENPIAD